MGMLDDAQAAMKLSNFLTPRNLQFLGVLLAVVTEESTPAFKAVWARFAAYFPKNPNVPTQALAKLRELRQILIETGKI